MAGETKRIYGTTKTLESTGASVASAAMSAAASSTLLTADTADYPHAVFTLTATFGAAPAAMLPVDVYARPLDIDGTTDAPVPTTSYKHRYVGTFLLANSTQQTVEFIGYNLPRNCEFYLHNQSGQTMNPWALKATPFTYGPA